MAWGAMSVFVGRPKDVSFSLDLLGAPAARKPQPGSRPGDERHADGNGLAVGEGEIALLFHGVPQGVTEV